MRDLKLKGIVLREAEYGEGNKILTVFSDTNGIISVQARRAKSKSYRYLASVQTFAYSEFELYKGMGMYNLNSATLIEPFYNLRNDLDILTIAGKMVWLCSKIVQEEQPEQQSLRLLLNTLYFLNTGSKSPLTLHNIFRLRLLSQQGFEPRLNSCGACAKEPEGQDVVFSVTEKSIFCSDCITRSHDIIKIDYDVLASMIYICNSSIEKLYSIAVSTEVETVLDYICSMLIKDCVEK